MLETGTFAAEKTLPHYRGSRGSHVAASLVPRLASHQVQLLVTGESSVTVRM